MPGELQKHYRSLVREFSAIVTRTFAGGRSIRFGQVHGYLEGWETWISVLDERPERKLLVLGVREYRLALLALSQGHYRSAFASLRAFLEAALATIFFAGHEILLRQWMADDYDLRWSVLSDASAGPLSLQFVRAFSPELAEFAEQYRAIAIASYRNCSEYVHGNWEKMAILPGQASFDQAAFDSWLERAQYTNRVLEFAFTSRYFKFLSAQSRSLIEPVIRAELNHVPAVRDLLDEYATHG